MAGELFVAYDGTPSFGLYAIIRKQSDGTVYSTVTTAFAAWADGSIADYDVSLASQGGDLFSATFPIAIAAGDYVVYYYELAGATPAITDLELRTRLLHWTGTEVSTTPPVTPAGDYCDRGDIEDIFGVSNTAQYSQLESPTSGAVGAGADTGRIQRGINFADAQINAAMRPYYTVPMTLADEAIEIVKWWAAMLAGIWMYKARFGAFTKSAPATPGKDNRGAQYAAWEAEVWAQIRMFKRGALAGDLLLQGATRKNSSIPAVADGYGTSVTDADLARRRFRDAWLYGPWYRDVVNS